MKKPRGAIRDTRCYAGDAKVAGKSEFREFPKRGQQLQVEQPSEERGKKTRSNKQGGAGGTERCHRATRGGRVKAKAQDNKVPTALHIAQKIILFLIFIFTANL